MLLRVLQFLVGAMLAGGGGYLGWTQRATATNIFPPGPGGLPLLLILSVLGVAAGIVFLVSAVHPRPNQKRAAAEKSVREDTALENAEAYYSERSRAADRDWRAAPITPPPASVPTPVPPPAPVKAAPVTPPPAAPAPLKAAPSAPPPAAPAPIAATPPPAAPVRPAPPAPVPPPAAPAPVTAVPPPAPVPPPPVPVQPAPPPKPVMQPVAPTAPPPPPVNPFPSFVNLAPIPRPPAAPTAPVAAPQVAPIQDGPHPAIRSAIASGKLAEAEQMLNAARETATGVDLAHLTALAGDHAAAAGQQGHARWLWRLATKRFGENGAAGTPDAQRIAAILTPPK